MSSNVAGKTTRPYKDVAKKSNLALKLTDAKMGRRVEGGRRTSPQIPQPHSDIAFASPMNRDFWRITPTGQSCVAKETVHDTAIIKISLGKVRLPQR
jgi:hypothetical protein